MRVSAMSVFAIDSNDIHYCDSSQIEKQDVINDGQFILIRSRFSIYFCIHIIIKVQIHMYISRDHNYIYLYVYRIAKRTISLPNAERTATSNKFIKCNKSFEIDFLSPTRSSIL